MERVYIIGDQYNKAIGVKYSRDYKVGPNNLNQ